jgi:hypothetical protein
MILQELKRSFMMHGLNVDTTIFGNEVVVTISPDELKNTILSSIPQYMRPYVNIECGSITVRIKLPIGEFVK